MSSGTESSNTTSITDPNLSRGYLLRRGIELLREEHPQQLAKAATEYLRPRCCPPRSVVRYALWLRHKRKPLSYTDADPFKIIYVDPDALTEFEGTVNYDDSRIAYDDQQRVHKWNNLGYVVDGDWDQHTTEWGGPLYRAMRERFCHGRDWEETKFIQTVLENINNGESGWRACQTEAEVLDRCEEIDELYESIRQNGYRKHPPRSTFAWQAEFDELTVNVGRNGELIRNNSANNRLAVAKILDLDQIPARVLLRHREWQSYRQEMRESESTDKPRHELPNNVDHPDLLDIR